MIVTVHVRYELYLKMFKKVRKHKLNLHGVGNDVYGAFHNLNIIESSVAFLPRGFLAFCTYCTLETTMYLLQIEKVKYMRFIILI